MIQKVFNGLVLEKAVQLLLPFHALENLIIRAQERGQITPVTSDFQRIPKQDFIQKKGPI